MNPRLLIVHSAAALLAALALGPVSASSPAALTYAIRGARIITMAGTPIDSGVIVMRDGVIVDVGASAAVPPDAIVTDGAGLTVYPGLIDMGNDAPLDTGEPDPAAGGRGGGRGGGGGPTFATLEEGERVKRAAILRPDFMAADNLRTASAELSQLASAGITTVLAVPASGIFKGQSALVNVAVPADDPQISTIADYRKGLGVVRSPVASHVNPAGRGGGAGYPNSLLGTVAFTRQGFLDAQWQRDAQGAYAKGGGRGPRPLVEPSLDALAPALARQIPVAFDAAEAREIDRVLAIATEFNLDPIVMGADNAAERTAELAAAKARVIYNLNLPGRGGGAGGGGGGGGGGGRGGGGATSLRVMKQQADAPKTPAALAKAGVPFAFTSNGSTAAQFRQNAGRVVKEGGLAADATLRALTIDAARIAGAADRVGSLERGKIANVVAVKGDILDGGEITHVFIDGRPVDITAPPAAGTGRGRGGN
jgi:imidazolonepropionase-like amidohydrolase